MNEQALNQIEIEINELKREVSSLEDKLEEQNLFWNTQKEKLRDQIATLEQRRVALNTVLDIYRRKEI